MWSGWLHVPSTAFCKLTYLHPKLFSERYQEVLRLWGWCAYKNLKRQFLALQHLMHRFFHVRLHNFAVRVLNSLPQGIKKSGAGMKLMDLRSRIDRKSSQWRVKLETSPCMRQRISIPWVSSIEMARRVTEHKLEWYWMTAKSSWAARDQDERHDSMIVESRRKPSRSARVQYCGSRWLHALSWSISELEAKRQHTSFRSITSRLADRVSHQWRCALPKHLHAFLR